MTTPNKKPPRRLPKAAEGTAFAAHHSTATPDPLKGWFDLAGNVKPSRNRPQKRGWQRGRR